MNPEPSNRPGPDILGSLCYQVLLASIPGNLCDQMVCRSSQDLMLSLNVSRESKSPFLEVWHKRVG